MWADGTDVKQLTGLDSAGESKHPAWSPDGAHICVASRRDGYASLYLARADGSGEQRLTAAEGLADEFPAWSPDGVCIAFSRGNGRGPEDIWVVDLAVRQELRLTDRGLMDYRPTWSPDGAQIAFRRSLGRTPGVYVVPASGGRPVLAFEGRSPSWHPEGGRIAYAHGGGIFTVAVDAEGRPVASPVRLTPGRAVADDYPCWSPDGESLAFERETDAPELGEAHIITVRADGGGIRDLEDGHTPAWSPVVAN